MKRAGIIAVVLLAAAAMAQVHGVPASVTSQTSKGYTPGVPASVTSLGPNGYGTPFGTPPMRPTTTVSCYGGGLYCYPTTSPPVNSGFNGRHHRHDGNGYGYGYGYGYSPYTYYPPNSVTDYSSMGSGYDYLQPSTTTVTPEPDPPAPTIFERRPATRPYARDEARYDDNYRGPAAEPGARPTAVGEQDTTTLIFADGHQLDLHNYAIVGQTLFNFDGTGPFKVRLAELDLGATEKINEDRGVEFKLPK